MNILEKDIIIKWNAFSKSHYESLGYIYTKMFDEFTVKIEHLQRKSSIRITAICIKCNTHRKISFHAYRDLCKICANKVDVLSRPIKNRIYETCSDRNILEEKISIKWNTTTRYHFVNAGYEFTKFGDYFEVLVKDLPKSSNAKVTALCEACEAKREISYSLYHPLCKTCALERTNNDIELKNKRVNAIREMHSDPVRREKWMKTHSKDGHPFWNPEKIDEERIIKRKTIENKFWALEVKKIGNYKCSLCGYKGNKLVSHHLMGYDSFPELRYDVNNGVCLCKACHIEFHKGYGYGDNTKSQFEEFSFYKRLNNIISMDAYKNKEQG